MLAAVVARALADVPCCCRRGRCRLPRVRAATVPITALVVCVPLADAARRADVDVLQRLRALPVARRHLHDDVILVLRVVDGRDLALAEGVVQRVVDLAGVDAQPAGGGAVDHAGRFPAPSAAGRN